MLKNEFEKFFVFLQQVELDINHGHLLPGGGLCISRPGVLIVSFRVKKTGLILCSA